MVNPAGDFFPERTNGGLFDWLPETDWPQDSLRRAEAARGGGDGRCRSSEPPPSRNYTAPPCTPVQQTFFHENIWCQVWGSGAITCKTNSTKFHRKNLQINFPPLQTKSFSYRINKYGFAIEMSRCRRSFEVFRPRTVIVKTFHACSRQVREKRRKSRVANKCSCYYFEFLKLESYLQER